MVDNTKVLLVVRLTQARPNDMTIAYSVCVQYSHVTADLILIAVDQEDIEWSSQSTGKSLQSRYPEAYCPITHLLIHYRQLINHAFLYQTHDA